ncbi:hypothetical protein BJ878DRAFT_187390 [Calycina marina]|uniref:BTB domain-containing protein n=1 Tax=Calycina marina TaxID=1763456 RepID=A0A9P7YYP4_9HELO|nr:hypothetical protein BJ878DRAFT_187390 [Calycina marina]
MFMVHRDLVSFHSPYFQNLLNQRSVTISTKVNEEMARRDEGLGDLGSVDENGKVTVRATVKLPAEVVSEIFLDVEKFGPVRHEVIAAFVEWLYNGFDGFGIDQVKPPGMYPITERTLVELWVFAGRAGVPACQNACIEGLEQYRQETGVIAWEGFDYIYDNTKEYKNENNGLKKLVIDQCAWNIDMRVVDTMTEQEFPRAARFDIAERLQQVTVPGMAGKGIYKDAPETAHTPYDEYYLRK